MNKIYMWNTQLPSRLLVDFIKNLSSIPLKFKTALIQSRWILSSKKLPLWSSQSLNIWTAILPVTSILNIHNTTRIKLQILFLNSKFSNLQTLKILTSFNRKITNLITSLKDTHPIFTALCFSEFAFLSVSSLNSLPTGSPWSVREAVLKPVSLSFWVGWDN